MDIHRFARVLAVLLLAAAPQPGRPRLTCRPRHKPATRTRVRRRTAGSSGTNRVGRGRRGRPAADLDPVLGDAWLAVCGSRRHDPTDEATVIALWQAARRRPRLAASSASARHRGLTCHTLRRQGKNSARPKWGLSAEESAGTIEADGPPSTVHVIRTPSTVHRGPSTIYHPPSTVHGRFMFVRTSRLP